MFHSGEPSFGRHDRLARCQIQAPNDDRLRELHLEVAYAFTADGATEARHGRLADIGAVGDLGIGGIDRKAHVVEHYIGDPALGGAKLGIGILDLGEDVGNGLAIAGIGSLLVQ